MRKPLTGKHWPHRENVILSCQGTQILWSQLSVGDRVVGAATLLRVRGPGNRIPVWTSDISLLQAALPAS